MGSGLFVTDVEQFCFLEKFQDILWGTAFGVEAADNSAGTGAGDNGRSNAFFFQQLQGAGMSYAAGASTPRLFTCSRGSSSTRLL